MFLFNLMSCTLYLLSPYIVRITNILALAVVLFKYNISFFVVVLYIPELTI